MDIIVEKLQNKATIGRQNKERGLISLKQISATSCPTHCRALLSWLEKGVSTWLAVLPLIVHGFTQDRFLRRSGYVVRLRPLTNCLPNATVATVLQWSKLSPVLGAAFPRSNVMKSKTLLPTYSRRCAIMSPCRLANFQDGARRALSANGV